MLDRKTRQYIRKMIAESVGVVEVGEDDGVVVDGEDWVSRLVALEERVAELEGHEHPEYTRKRVKKGE